MSDKINPEHYKRLPAEAIEIIESAIQNAPRCQDAYLQGQALKYLLRCWHKEGITDVKKAKWYIDRLIESYDKSLADIKQGLVKAWTCEDGKAKQVYPKQPQPPDGWRWLSVGEKILDGDKFFRDGDWLDCRFSVGDKIKKDAMPTIRRNRFEVGEKVVVECVNNRIGVVKDIEAIGSGKNFLCHVEMQDTKGMIVFSPHQLAPYIEETT